jgi:hypothetical protein
MNTHPDVMWELVKDHQARLRQEAQVQNRARLFARARSRAKRGAGTLAACEQGAAD